MSPHQLISNTFVVFNGNALTKNVLFYYELLILSEKIVIFGNGWQCTMTRAHGFLTTVKLGLQEKPDARVLFIVSFHVMSSFCQP